jgi:hypothetical protein
MSRAGVVPGVRALLRGAVALFEEHDAKIRLELFEENGERCAHHACADQNDVRLGVE